MRELVPLRDGFPLTTIFTPINISYNATARRNHSFIRKSIMRRLKAGLRKMVGRVGVTKTIVPTVLDRKSSRAVMTPHTCLLKLILAVCFPTIPLRKPKVSM